MSEEYNRYDLGNDPEEKSETAATTENVSAENTSYAFSYRKAGEERKDQGNEESFTRTYTGSHREYTHDAGQNQNSDKSTQTLTAPIIFLLRFRRSLKRR